MSWKEISDRKAIIRAIEEFDQLGRDAFLGKYRFGRSARYMLEHGGNKYDAKAIIGAAHGFQFPEKGPLRSESFPSSQKAVKGTLEHLGFTVVTS